VEFPRVSRQFITGRCSFCFTRFCIGSSVRHALGVPLLHGNADAANTALVYALGRRLFDQSVPGAAWEFSRDFCDPIHTQRPVIGSPPLPDCCSLLSRSPGYWHSSGKWSAEFGCRARDTAVYTCWRCSTKETGVMLPALYCRLTSGSCKGNPPPPRCAATPGYTGMAGGPRDLTWCCASTLSANLRPAQAGVSKVEPRGIRDERGRDRCKLSRQSGLARRSEFSSTSFMPPARRLRNSSSRWSAGGGRLGCFSAELAPARWSHTASFGSR